jgi:hypothetical protein
MEEKPCKSMENAIFWNVTPILQQKVTEFLEEITTSIFRIEM